MKPHLQFESPTINPIIGVAKIEETLLPAMSLPIALVLSSGGNCTPISVVAIERTIEYPTPWKEYETRMVR
jgi:hypothetical protein